MSEERKKERKNVHIVKTGAPSSLLKVHHHSLGAEEECGGIGYRETEYAHNAMAEWYSAVC